MSILKELRTPVFYAEGEPVGIDRENYRLEVGGLIENPPLIFTFRDIETMPFSEVNSRLTSVSGWSVRALWQGVLFRDFLKFIKLDPSARYVKFESFGGYTTSVPLSELEKEIVVLCYKVNGEDLETQYGGPLRMIVPQWWGYKSIKGLKRMEFIEESEPGYWENLGYPDYAPVEPGFTLDVNTGVRRRISGGEVREF